MSTEPDRDTYDRDDFADCAGREVPVTIDGVERGRATLGVDDRGVVYAVTIPGGDAQETAGSTAGRFSFAFREPEPDAVPRDPLAPRPPKIR